MNGFTETVLADWAETVEASVERTIEDELAVSAAVVVVVVVAEFRTTVFKASGLFSFWLSSVLAGSTTPSTWNVMFASETPATF